MYIISKYKDYYDGVVGSVGMDKTIVYERNTEEITEHKKYPKEFQQKQNSWNNKNPFISVCHVNVDKKKTKKYHGADGFIVGFCGKLYIGWKLYYKVKEWGVLGYDDVTKTDIIYGEEEGKKYLRSGYWGANFSDDIKYIKKYNPIQLFRDIKAPIFVYDDDRSKPRNDSAFIVNPNLKDWEFYKVVDAFTAFTELQMFIGGVLGTGEKEIIEIEDKYKIGQHGFDKWSFRRKPSKK